MNRIRHRWTGLMIIALVACASALLPTGCVLAATPPVSVTLEPRQIAVGDSAQLTITSSGSAMQAISLPNVPGLEFRVVGQSRRVEIIHGATLASTAIIVRVTAQTAGIFTIPGLTPNSQPLVLRVNPEGSSGSGASSGSSRFPARPPLAGGSASSNGLHMTADGSAFVKFALPKRAVYVGESIPVDIEVGMHAGFVTSLNGLPTLTGSEFTLNNLSHQPERAEKLIDGKPFVVLTWHSVLAPVKPGTFTLSVETPLTVRVRVESPKDSMIDDLLGDPFLQNFFGATVPKDITVASPPAELVVQALPTLGRPADFSGAVGSFKIATDISPSNATTGDPLTLRMHVSGAGNFDRVDSPMLEHLEHWKTYPPTSSFKSSDPVGFKGEKSFEQPLVAAQPGAQVLPGVAFSYFDPNTRRYETLRSEPLNVTIAPSLADSTLTAPQSSRTAATPIKAPPDGLRADHAAATRVAHSLLPLYLQPRFLALPSLLAIALAGGWLGLRRRTAHSATRRPERLSVTAKRALARMEFAANARDPVAFFTAARLGLEQALAARWRIAPQDLTADELDARLGDGTAADADLDGRAEIRRLFTLADEANYSGDVLSSTDFDRWTAIVRRQFAAERAS